MVPRSNTLQRTMPQSSLLHIHFMCRYTSCCAKQSTMNQPCGPLASSEIECHASWWSISKGIYLVLQKRNILAVAQMHIKQEDCQKLRSCRTHPSGNDNEDGITTTWDSFINFQNKQWQDLFYFPCNLCHEKEFMSLFFYLIMNFVHKNELRIRL